MLPQGDFSEIEEVLDAARPALRGDRRGDQVGTRAHQRGEVEHQGSMLYLTILTETKNMVLQSRNLLKSQQYFLRHRNEPKNWIK